MVPLHRTYHSARALFGEFLPARSGRSNPPNAFGEIDTSDHRGPSRYVGLGICRGIRAGSCKVHAVTGTPEDGSGPLGYKGLLWSRVSDSNR